MKAKIYEFWVAWSSTGGWPRRILRCYIKPNESTKRVWHLGLVILGRSFEFRFGVCRRSGLSDELRALASEHALEVLHDAADALDAYRIS